MDALLPVDAETPRSLVLDPPLTDAQFQELCAANDLVYFERTEKGEILMRSPVGGFTTRGKCRDWRAAYLWWKTHLRGWVCDSSGGFFLPDGSMLNPDTAYVLRQKLQGLDKDDLTGFPIFALISSLSCFPPQIAFRRRSRRWNAGIENGVALGWLIDPYEKRVYIYEPGREAAAVSGNTVQGSGPVEGFTLDLDEVWRCFEI